MRTYYCFAREELIEAGEIYLPMVAERGDILSCFGLLYEVVGEFKSGEKHVYQLRFI